MRLIAILPLACILALAACKGDDRRRDRDRDRDEPRTEEPAEPGAPAEPSGLSFRSTTGSGVVESPANTFAIPRCGAGKLGYVTMRWTGARPIAGTMSLSWRIDASADARIVGHERRGDQGRLHLHFQRSGDDWSAGKLDAGYRQWSSAQVLLAPSVGAGGGNTLSVPLMASQWGNRNGFDAARERVENVGFTLGDNQTKGHGVCMMSGTASLTVTGFSIQ